MPKRAQITASQLRQGIGPLITLLLQGHEVALIHYGVPIGVIRGWTDADGPAPEPDASAKPAEQVKPVTRTKRAPPKPPPETGGRTWAGKEKFPTSHLKPMFSTPPE